jgi:hypothetical protein
MEIGRHINVFAAFATIVSARSVRRTRQNLPGDP